MKRLLLLLLLLLLSLARVSDALVIACKWVSFLPCNPCARP
jgi:hypothetical protein